MLRLRTCLLLLLAGCGARETTSAPKPTPPETPAARKAPDFTLSDTEGQPVTLSRLLKDGPVILAFFPKAFTGG